LDDKTDEINQELITADVEMHTVDYAGEKKLKRKIRQEVRKSEL